MINTFLKNFSGGIPIYKPINIYLNDICLLSPKKDEVQRIVSLEYEKFISFLRSYTGRYVPELFLTICITSNNETLEREIHLSPDGFISSLLYNLNLDNICYKNNYRDITFEDCIGKDGERLHDKVGVLRGIGLAYLDKQKKLLEDKSKKLQEIKALEENNSISSKQKHRIGKLRKEIKDIDDELNYKLDKRTEKELLEKFPYLKLAYTELKKERETIRKTKAQINDEKTPERTRKIIYNNLASRLKKQGYTEDIDTILKEVDLSDAYFFIREYSDSLENLINNIPDIINFLLNNKIEIDDLGIPYDQLELYIANRAMESCEYNSNQDRQNYIYYVTSYFKNRELRENEDLSITIEIDNAGNLQKITPKSLYERYEQFLLKNPDVRPLDLSVIDFSNMELTEIQEFINSYLEDLKANWEIIPKEVFRTEVKNVIENKERSIDKDRLQRNLLNLFIEKTEFYATLNTYEIIRGINNFEGYRGFVFTNGIVVLEKFYDDVEKKKLRYGAIFAMNINDFHELSKVGKKELWTNPKVKRIIHDDDWQEDVLSVIGDQNRKINPSTEIKRLIKIGEIQDKKH